MALAESIRLVRTALHRQRAKIGWLWAGAGAFGFALEGLVAGRHGSGSVDGVFVTLLGLLGVVAALGGLRRHTGLRDDAKGLYHDARTGLVANWVLFGIVVGAFCALVVGATIGGWVVGTL